MTKTELKNKALLQEFETFLSRLGLEFEKEIVFNTIMPTKRQFRADYYIPNSRTIIEINGGQFIGGRHNRGGKGYENDLMKSNLANTNNFIYLQFTYEMLARLEYHKFFKMKKEDIIIDAVIRYCGKNILLKTRKREFSEPRQLAMYFIRLNTKLHSTSIGKLFGKDHATVLHAVKTISDLINIDKAFKTKYAPLFEQFEGRK